MSDKGVERVGEAFDSAMGAIEQAADELASRVHRLREDTLNQFHAAGQFCDHWEGALGRFKDRFARNTNLPPSAANDALIAPQEVNPNGVEPIAKFLSNAGGRDDGDATG
jgi:hypothetical protein